MLLLIIIFIITISLGISKLQSIIDKRKQRNTHNQSIQFIS